MIHFRTVTGKMFDLEMKETDTISDAKRIISEEEGFDCQNCDFVLGTQFLEDSTPFAAIDIKPSQFIILHTKVKPEIERKKGLAPALSVDSQGSSSSISHGYGSDPPDFEEKISTLTEMGFTRAQCEAALRKNQYNVEAAINMIFSGGDTFADTPPQPQYQPRQNNTPAHHFPNAVQGWPGQNIQQNIPQSNYLVSSGQDTSQYPGNNDSFDDPAIPDTLTPSEKEAVKRIFKKYPGYDKSLIVDIYMDSGKNENQVISLLSSM